MTKERGTAVPAIHFDLKLWSAVGRRPIRTEWVRVNCGPWTAEEERDANAPTYNAATAQSAPGVF